MLSRADMICSAGQRVQTWRSAFAAARLCSRAADGPVAARWPRAPLPRLWMRFGAAGRIIRPGSAKPFLDHFWSIAGRPWGDPNAGVPIGSTVMRGPRCRCHPLKGG